MSGATNYNVGSISRASEYSCSLNEGTDSSWKRINEETFIRGFCEIGDLIIRFVTHSTANPIRGRRGKGMPIQYIWWKPIVVFFNVKVPSEIKLF
jgi:hypothetical protein